MFGHGFMEGDTGSAEELLSYYKLDPIGLEEVIKGVLNDWNKLSSAQSNKPFFLWKR